MPSLTGALEKELRRAHCERTDVGLGYSRVSGFPYPSWIVVVDEVASAERDDLLGAFGHGKLETREARWWLEAHAFTPSGERAMQDLEDYDELLIKVLSKMPPEQRLAGIPPEQRLAGIPREQAILAMPNDVLAGLSDDFVRTLSPETQAEIRRRTGRS